MKNSILSATFSCAIFLNASAILAGQWTEVPGAGSNNSATYGVAVVSANDAWAVGHARQARALIEHWDGTTWSLTATQPSGTTLLGIAARSASDVWAVGSIVVSGGLVVKALVEHWNGQQWSVIPSPSVGTYDTLHAVSIISRNDVWAVGYTIRPVQLYILMHWDGTSWSVVNGPQANASALLSVKAFVTDDVWAVGYKDYDIGSSTFTLHWDGTAWSEVPSPNAGDGNYLQGVDGAGPNDIWAVGNSPVGALAMHWDGTAWTVVPTTVENGWFDAVKALSTTNVFAVGTIGNQPLSARWDGTQWRVIPTPPVNIPGWLSAISGRGGSIWAVGVQGPERKATDLIFNWTQSSD